jgi:hypothetical protein
MAATTLGALHHEALGHDADFVPFVEHDASAHRIQGNDSASPAHPLHCLVCQWARSLRSRPGTTFNSAPVVPTGQRLQPDFVAVTPAARAAQPPLRSPPHA